MPPKAATVVLTDYAWPDLAIERRVIEEAGYALYAGPSEPSSAEVVEAIVAERQPAAILTNWARVSERAIAASAGLRVVARLGVGLDNIAVDAATRRGVWVTNVPDYCVEEVSDHAVAMVLAWARGLVVFDREVKAGRWDPASARLRRVCTLCAGILGYGRIGRGTARKLKAFGMRIVAHDAYARIDDAVAESVPLDELLRCADVVIVHVPLSAETRHLLDRARIGSMQRGAFLVNVSRGGIVDNDALMEGLESGRLSGAGLDVLDGEPDVPAGLRDRPDVILTPHVAFSSDASLVELRQRACEEVVRVLRGETPRHPCNTPAARRGCD